MKKVVIVGGGFGGVYTARNVEKLLGDEVEVVLISKAEYFLFTPLLHEVATGTLSPHSVSENLRDIFHGTNVRVVQGEVKLVNRGESFVETEGGRESFDYLVVATGAETHFFGVEHEGVLKLKTLSDATKIRNSVITSFQKHREGTVRFVVVGAGPTGVELATELSEFVYGSLCRKFGIAEENVEIVLVHSGGEILPQFSQKTRQYAQKSLKKKRIRLVLNTRVVSLTDEKVTFESGECVDASVVVWTAGVHPRVPSFIPGIEQEKERILVEDTLLLRGSDNIFVLGDSAAQDNPAPMLAQVAVAQANVVAENIRNSLRQKKLILFLFKSKGMLLSLGKWRASGNIGGVHIKGPIAWWIWRTIYLFKFLSWRKRVKIMFEWTYDLFSSREVTKL